MSTFDGIVSEFPNIRIDCFRHYPGLPIPAACFLSHVHSDHLLGLDTLKSPFVYCSAATRRLLLRMEKYPHRINFSKGILEARKQTYKHLKTILRPLPLNSSVDLELSPKSHIRVTLFDANHCPGAVMFLIEGDGKAILYTGDIRAEPWWVNALARQPSLIPYTNSCKLHTLDCIYLDTTFASHYDIHRKFPTKAEGLSELLRKLSQYSAAETVFYFRAWTLGYEDVWVLLNRALNSQIHVDEYQVRLFRNIAEDGLGAEPGPVLSGYQVGNAEHPGCLTMDPDVKIHSCEPGTLCHTRIKKNKDVVWITPIISRLEDGSEIAELGAGGGHGDLYQHQDEVDLGDKMVVDALRLLYEKTCEDPVLLKAFDERVAALKCGQNLTFEGLDLDPAVEVTLRDFLTALANKPEAGIKHSSRIASTNIIHFPYSRHSSYDELHHLLSLFCPKDICPCTVDIDRWEQDQLSMESLFGDVCSGSTFKYDRDIEQEIERRRPLEDVETEATQKNDGRTQSQTSEQGEPDLQQMLQQHVTDEAANQPPKLSSFLVSPEAEVSVKAERTLNKGMLRDIWRAANIGSSFYSPGAVIPAQADVQHHFSDTDSIDFDLQARLEEAVNTKPLDRSRDADKDPHTYTSINLQAHDVQLRAEAFEAALYCMETGDDSVWRNVKLQSLARGYHTYEEPEL